jgi:hypothetical protein
MEEMQEKQKCEVYFFHGETVKNTHMASISILMQFIAGFHTLMGAFIIITHIWTMCNKWYYV